MTKMAPVSNSGSGAMQHHNAYSVLTSDASDIVASVFKQDLRVLLFGAPGVGKSTLATQLARCLAQLDRRCWCLSTDPGSPLLGVPGAVSLGQWHQDAWQTIEYAALCTLDAGRFRLPLVSAARQLLQRSFDGILLIDSPGVVRGVAGSELLVGLVAAAHADAVLIVLPTKSSTPPLLDELGALAVPMFVIPAATEAMRPGKRTRMRRRTERWDAYLSDAVTQVIDLDKINIIGTPPPREEGVVWVGRQVALLQGQRTLQIGEVQQLVGNVLKMILPMEVNNADTLLIRDAQRMADGGIATAVPFAAERFGYLPPADVLSSADTHNGPRFVGRVGAVDVVMINGVFGDPLLHVRLRYQRRSLMFDLGSGDRIPASVAHQVTDVFITHAHMDHIGGFLWLLRSRIGEFPPCRLYGPPGLSQHIAGFMRGVLWDRVNIKNAPKFEVLEFHGNCLRCFDLLVTHPEPQFHKELNVEDGVLHQETGFKVRGVMLDHQGTAVVAYAFEADKQINVRKDRLTARSLEPGTWLSKLKQHLLRGKETARIRLPDGSDATVAELAAEFVLISPGKKLVYATDLADTIDNRQRLVPLAKHAHTFFCEAKFIKAASDHALRNGHLTTCACGEIATSAGVERLVPFHFSRRYISQLEQIYDEVKSVCTRVVVPPSDSDNNLKIT